MQKNILQKALDELNKETPNIEKVKGMLETLCEMDTSLQPVVPYTPSYPIYPSQPFTMPGTVYTTSNETAGGGTGILSDEDKLAQIYGGGQVGNVQ